MQPFDFENAIDRQRWEWLFDLSRRLNVVVEVVDARQVSLFSAGSPSAAASLRRILIADEPQLRSIISDVMHSTTSKSMAIDGLEVTSFGLVPTGALVLAREIGGADPAGARRDLELIGSWLTGVLEATLSAAPNAISAEPYRIASLCRILNEATTRGSIRKVVGAFVEALGVWDRVHVHSYVGAASGGFLQFVSPMGTTPASLPAALDASVVPTNGEMVRLSRSEVDRFGLASEQGDVFLLRILTGIDVPWILVLQGAIDSREQVRLRLYSEILREALNDVILAATNRLIATATRQQRSQNGSIEAVAQTILGELTLAVGGQDAALIVTLATGRQVLTLGGADLVHAPEHDAAADRLEVVSSDGGRVTVVIVRDQPRFTAFEREMVQAAVASVHPWLRGTLQHSSERRRRFRPVDALFEQLAVDAVQAGEQASVIVISIGANALRSGAMQAWLAKIKDQLRSWDFVGILSDKEIAVLLCGASAEAAEGVSARLKRLIESDDATDESIRPTIGMTTCPPKSPFEHSAIGAARANAAMPSSI
jgi:hypothetical protein